MKMLNKIKLGKIKIYNPRTQVGEIVDEEGNIYMFLNKDSKEEIVEKDIVQFRGEMIENTLRAFFIKKIEINEDTIKEIDDKNNLKEKTYRYTLYDQKEQ